jgi:hypothetical protein
MSSLNTRDSYENLKLGKTGGNRKNGDRTQVEHRKLRREFKNKAIFQPLSALFMVAKMHLRKRQVGATPMVAFS